MHELSNIINSISQLIATSETVFVISVLGELDDLLKDRGYNIISMCIGQFSHQTQIMSLDLYRKFDNILISSDIFHKEPILSTFLLIAYQRSNANSKIVVYGDIEKCLTNNYFEIQEKYDQVAIFKKITQQPYIIIRSRWLMAARTLNDSLIKYFHNKGYLVNFIAGKFTAKCNIDEEIKNSKHVFIWNGISDDDFISSCNKLKMPVSFMEAGIELKRYFYIDNQGINLKRSIFSDNFDWITSKHLRQLEEFRGKYYTNKWTGNGDYILCLLDSEANLRHNNSHEIRNVQQFIDHVEQKYPDMKIVFKPHPLDRSQYTISEQNLIIRENLIDLIISAKLVCGGISTSFFKAALSGAPVQSVFGIDISEKMLAAIIDRQIPLSCSGLDEYISKIGLSF